MKIVLTWIPSGTSQPTRFTLADSPANVPLTNFRISGSPNMQEAQFFRATARSFYDRGNVKTEISFDTTRLWPDQNTAEAFMLMHAATLPDQANVTFTTGSGAGSSSTRYLKNAGIQTIASSLTGCTTKHSYRITGGEMSTTSS